MSKGVPVIVEGKNDEKALKELGLKGTYKKLSAKSFSELAQEIATKNKKKVIILTDNDDYGNKSAEKLRKSFLNECVKPDLSYRTRFRELTGVRQFEYLPSLLATIKEENNGKNIHRHNKIRNKRKNKDRRNSKET